jgi:hypothetical protein
MGLGSKSGVTERAIYPRLIRLSDFFRLRYPLKLDFCRMTLSELTSMMQKILWLDKEDPGQYRPIVAIGHTKDLVDFETVDGFLSFLMKNRVMISTFTDICPKICSRISRPEYLVPSLINSGLVK